MAVSSQVNGLLTHLPYRMGLEELYIYRKGWNMVIQTGFGLTVTFDWHSHLTVTVPKAYQGALEGLCGNFNGDNQDDFNGDGNSATLGQSWKVAETLGCGEASFRECPEFTNVAQRQRGISAECGLLVDQSGPFRECHGKIDPEVFFLDCVYDYCMFGGRQAVLQHIMEAYASACQATWVTIYIWRIHIYWSEYAFSLLCHGVRSTQGTLGHVYTEILKRRSCVFSDKAPCVGGS